MEIADQLLIQKIIASVDEYRASALHLSVGNPPMLRVQGKLVSMPDASIIAPAFLESVIPSWVDNVVSERLKRERHATFAFTFPNGKRFKISLFYQQGNVSASLNLLPDRVPNMQELRLPVAAQQFAQVDSGFVLICGPFGSGRTTTMASFVEERNMTRQQHIVTIEDPTEFIFQDKQCVIEQREVGRDVAAIADALHFTLDEDVDVVFVTSLELRDEFRAALDVAIAGKMLYGSMNASTIGVALSMMIHSFEENEQERIRAELSNALVGFMNQRLVPLREGGTILATEVVVPNDAIRSVIASGDMVQLEQLVATSTDSNIQSLDRTLQHLVDSGKIHPDVAYRTMIHHPASAP